jgi:hypothetical protein
MEAFGTHELVTLAHCLRDAAARARSPVVLRSPHKSDWEQRLSSNDRDLSRAQGANAVLQHESC